MGSELQPGANHFPLGQHQHQQEEEQLLEGRFRQKIDLSEVEINLLQMLLRYFTSKEIV